jgi:DNA-binding NtrC family response regulator
MKTSPHLLIVDDDPDVTAMLKRSLLRRGFRIDVTSSPDDAILKAASTDYDAAILDLVMPGRDGVDLLAVLRERNPSLPAALLTGYNHSPLLENVSRSGVAVFLKPVAIQDLVDFLQAEIP